jgi:hypothetical protein
MSSPHILCVCAPLAFFSPRADHHQRALWIGALSLSVIFDRTAGANQFKGCSQLRTIMFSSSLTTIKDGAFDGCVNLRSIDLRKTAIVSIGAKAFHNNPSLLNVYLPNGVAIGSNAFKCGDFNTDICKCGNFIEGNSGKWVFGDADTKFTFDATAPAIKNLFKTGAASAGNCYVGTYCSNADFPYCIRKTGSKIRGNFVCANQALVTSTYISEESRCDCQGQKEGSCDGCRAQWGGSYYHRTKGGFGRPQGWGSSCDPWSTCLYADGGYDKAPEGCCGKPLPAGQMPLCALDRNTQQGDACTQSGFGARQPKDCFCGGDENFCAANSYCYEGQCRDNPPCEHTDGRTKNAEYNADCTCNPQKPDGTGELCTGHMRYCFDNGNEGQCIIYPLCDNANQEKEEDCHCNKWAKDAEGRCGQSWGFDWNDDYCVLPQNGRAGVDGARPSGLLDVKHGVIPPLTRPERAQACVRIHRSASIMVKRIATAQGSMMANVPAMVLCT